MENLNKDLGLQNQEQTFVNIVQVKYYINWKINKWIKADKQIYIHNILELTADCIEYSKIK